MIILHTSYDPTCPAKPVSCLRLQASSVKRPASSVQRPRATAVQQATANSEQQTSNRIVWLTRWLEDGHRTARHAVDGVNGVWGDSLERNAQRTTHNAHSALGLDCWS